MKQQLAISDNALDIIVKHTNGEGKENAGMS